MSETPNCREKYLTPKFKGTLGSKTIEMEKNPYWEGYLRGDNELVIEGFDKAMIDGVWNFFANLEIYESILKEATGLDDIEPDQSVMEDERSITEYTEEELNEMTPATRLFKGLQDCIIDFIEDSRNQVITGMIEEMDEEEYERAVEEEAEDE